MNQTFQTDSINRVDKSFVQLIHTLKKSGMDDEMITYHLNQFAGKAEMYAEDIERGAMHLNKGFETWVNNN